MPAIQGLDPKTEAELTREASPEAPFSALAFKVMSDPFVGKLTYFRSTRARSRPATGC